MESPGQFAVEQIHDHDADHPDIALLQWFQGGCSDCFSILFYRYCHTVYSIAWKVLRDRGEAEDVVQEVFLAIHQQRDRYDFERGTVKTWILHAVHFRALTRRRQLKGGLLDSIDVNLSLDRDLLANSRSAYEEPDRVVLIGRGLACLNERQRRVIELIHFEGYTLLEASNIVGESLANTRNLYYRGMKLLRESLAPSRVSGMLDGGVKQEDSFLLEAKTPILEH